METKDITWRDFDNSMDSIRDELRKTENKDQLNVIFFFISGQGITMDGSFRLALNQCASDGS